LAAPGEPALSATRAERRFFWLSVLFGAWNVVGSVASFGSGVLWSVLVSQEVMPSAGFLALGVVLGAVAVLAFAAARGRAHRRRLWALALAISAGVWVVGALRIGSSWDDWADLAVLVVVAFASLLLLRRPPPGRESPP
jgi:hypothetical protein